MSVYSTELLQDHRPPYEPGDVVRDYDGNDTYEGNAVARLAVRHARSLSQELHHRPEDEHPARPYFEAHCEVEDVPDTTQSADDQRREYNRRRKSLAKKCEAEWATDVPVDEVRALYEKKYQGKSLPPTQ